MVEDGSAPIDNIHVTASESTNEDIRTDWLSDGVRQVAEAVTAVVTARAKGVSIDTRDINAMISTLTAMQEQLAKAGYNASFVATDTPLGGGYAEHIGRSNREMGRRALEDVIPQLTQRMDELKAELDRSRASYKNVDATAEDTAANIARGIPS
ncbi:hypothetical protein ACWEFJ_19845 [Actinosynnema sp. NPDC004786]